MSTPFVGEIRPFAFGITPRGWAPCNGQLLSIQQNAALFSILGTTYGGNGTTTFALPDLRGRMPMHWGQGPGLSPVVLGEAEGTENVTLLITQLPMHLHMLQPQCNKQLAQTDQQSPVNDFPGYPDANNNGYALYATAATSGAAMPATATAPTGGSQPHSNLQPTLAINYMIALNGIFPSRN